MSSYASLFDYPHTGSVDRRATPSDPLDSYSAMRFGMTQEQGGAEGLALHNGADSEDPT